MHDTAFRIGTLAMNIYADLATATILEVGSQSINGSLRENVLPSTKYVGIDIEEGEGVDIVATPGSLPVEDDSFDLVIASSVFEHDSAFWMTFLEMCRKTKDGGYIYINAPSNGCVHRFPQDNWRFYPDSGTALAKWAVSQGQNVSLVESFLAERSDDIWNDFVAVFRKGRITKKLPQTFIYENVPSTNIITWRSKEIINPRDVTQDMFLFEQAKNQLKLVEDLLTAAVGERDHLIREKNEFQSQCDALRNELNASRRHVEDLGGVRDELSARQSELRQREEEIEQTRTELTETRAERDALESVRDELAARIEDLRQRDEALARNEASLVALRTECDELAARINELRQREEELTRAKSELDALRTERDELATQVDELRQRDEDLVKSQAELASVRGERDGLAARIARVDQINKSLTQKIENRTSTVERLERDRLALEATMQKAVHSATEQVAAAERARHEQQKAAQQAQSQMGARFQEIVTLTGLLRQEEHRSESIIGHLDWMRAVHESLTSQPRWWSLMPGTWRQEREKLRLKRHGLFDADIYLERYPDVAAAALDPLYHYMTHGFYEGRSKSA